MKRSMGRWARRLRFCLFVRSCRSSCRPAPGCPTCGPTDPRAGICEWASAVGFPNWRYVASLLVRFFLHHPRTLQCKNVHLFEKFLRFPPLSNVRPDIVANSHDLKTTVLNERNANDAVKASLKHWMNSRPRRATRRLSAEAVAQPVVRFESSDGSKWPALSVNGIRAEICLPCTRYSRRVDKAARANKISARSILVT